MDDYIVTSEIGARVRERPTTASDSLYTLPHEAHVEIDRTCTADGAVWCHTPKHGGWIRSDLLERYAHSAEPEPVIVTDKPDDAERSRIYNKAWNECVKYFAEIAEKAKRAE